MGIETSTGRTRNEAMDGSAVPLNKAAYRGLERSRMQRKQAETIFTITGAPKSLKDDVHSREKRYLISMGIRTVCFLLAIFVTEGLLRWLLIVAAIGLPYVAVILANAGRERSRHAPTGYHPPPGPELPAGTESSIDKGAKNSSKDLPGAPLQ